jgi:hypothetical protein
MDDYRDIVAAGFAIFCAALMLVAWLLSISDKPEHGNSDLRIEPPVAAPQSISKLERNLLLSHQGLYWR